MMSCGCALQKILDLLSLPCRDRNSSMLGQVLVKTSLTSELLWSSGGLCAWSRPCSLDASTASVAAGCGCAPRTLSGSKSAVHHLNDELRLRAPLSIVALAPSSLTATRCPQLKQVVRRCPRLPLCLRVKACSRV